MRTWISAMILLMPWCLGSLVAGDSIGLFQPQQQVNESTGWVEYLVTRTGTGVGAVSVDVQVVGGSATLGLDYAAPQPGTVQWADGDRAPKVVTLPILHDPAFTYGSYLTLSLVNPTGGAVIDPSSSSAILNIADMEANPAGQLALVVGAPNTALTVRDDAGTVAIQVQRCGGTLGAETCTIALNAGTAQPGIDYTVPGSTTLSWASGAGGVQTLLVPILPRTRAEGPLSFSATITSSSGNADFGYGYETVTIIDSLPTAAGTLEIPAAVNARELSGNAVITVARTGGSTGAVSVSYATSDDLAAAGVNYTAVSGTLTWANGDSAPKSILIPLLADHLARPPLDAFLTFSAPTGGLILPVNPITVLTILDDDGVAGLVGLSAQQASIGELSGQIPLTLTRSGGSTGAISVTYTCYDGTAITGVNYQGGTGTVQWADGDATPKIIAMPILNAGVPSASLWFSVSLSNPQGGAGLDDGATDRTYETVTIVNAYGGLPSDTIAFASPTEQAYQSDGSVIVGVVRSGTGIGPASIQLIVQAGTALPGVNFTVPSSLTVQWADGELGTQAVAVSLVDTGLPGPPSAFSIQLGVAYGNAAVSTAATQFQTDITILNDVPALSGTVSWSPSSQSASSTAGTIELTLQRSGGSSGAVSVDWSTDAQYPSTAVPGSDFVAAAGTVSWSAGDSSDKTISVTLLDDGLPGPGSTLVVHLDHAQGGCVIGVSDAQVAITDAGPMPAGTISCVTAAQTGDRTAGAASVLVARSGGSTGAVTVAYRTIAGTALDGIDFLPAVGTLSWADGDSAVRSIVIPVMAPAGAGAGELTLELSYPTGGAVLGLADTVLTLPVPASPVITSPTVATATMNTPFSYQITATRSPGSFGASGLPTGLSVDTTTGLVSGLLPAAGTSQFTATATNGGGTGSQVVAIVTAKALASVTIVMSSLSAVADGSPQPVSVVTVPSGLAVTVLYTVSSSPTATPPSAAGSYAVSATVTDAVYQGAAAGTLVITAPAPAPAGTGTTASTSSSSGGSCGLGSGVAAMGSLLSLALVGFLRRRT